MKQLFVIVVLLLQGCTYAKYWNVHSGYRAAQENDPSLKQLRYLIDEPNYFVYGRVNNTFWNRRYQKFSLVAFSNDYKSNEQVDAMFNATVGSYYVLKLPEGEYRLVVFIDKDDSLSLDRTEAFASVDVVVNSDNAVEKIILMPDISIDEEFALNFEFNAELPAQPENEESIFYPSGTIRSLDDPVFDRRIATMGLYDPTSFIDRAPTVFYALEEDIAYKIPVVFVHGIGGTPTEFKPLLDRLDRKKYKPWFFYYPSGGDLTQLAQLFYQIFLSGEVVPRSEMPMVVVAHSMGGLVVREAINRQTDVENENHIDLFFSLATPFGGNDKAVVGEKRAPLVLPAWRDLNPHNAFIQQLYRRPFPTGMEHHLLYAYANDSVIRLGKNSDGTIALASQLYYPAQDQASAQLGVDDSHTGILQNAAAIDYILDKLESVENRFPSQQLAWLYQGGYDIALDDGYSAESKHIVKEYGKFISALVNGKIEAVLPGQAQFVRVLQGKAEPRTDAEKDFKRFKQQYPQYFEVHPSAVKNQ